VGIGVRESAGLGGLGGKPYSSGGGCRRRRRRRRRSGWRYGCVYVLHSLQYPTLLTLRIAELFTKVQGSSHQEGWWWPTTATTWGEQQQQGRREAHHHPHEFRR
jgi:hypothetical protein